MNKLLILSTFGAIFVMSFILDTTPVADAKILVPELSRNDNGKKILRAGKYTVVEESVNSTEANEKCKSYGYGLLLSIETEFENGQIADVLTFSGSFNPALTSGIYNSASSSWVWGSTNQPMTFTDWMGEVPGSGVMMVTGYWNAYGWRGYPEGWADRFICELD